jgi:hypothetical protein
VALLGAAARFQGPVRLHDQANTRPRFAGFPDQRTQGPHGIIIRLRRHSMATITTRTLFFGSMVAVRANWSDPASPVTHVIAGIWMPTGRRVADAGDHMAALRAELEARARLLGVDSRVAKADIEAAMAKADSSDPD